MQRFHIHWLLLYRSHQISPQVLSIEKWKKHCTEENTNELMLCLSLFELSWISLSQVLKRRGYKCVVFPELEIWSLCSVWFSGWDYTRDYPEHCNMGQWQTCVKHTKNQKYIHIGFYVGHDHVCAWVCETERVSVWLCVSFTTSKLRCSILQ